MTLVLKDAKEFSGKYPNIREEDINLIEHTCQTILTYDNHAWIKKDGIVLLTYLWSFFVAKLCDLIGLYALNKLKRFESNPYTTATKSGFVDMTD